MLQNSIRPWFMPHTRWEVCVGHACMSIACVSHTLAFHVRVALHNVNHGCSKVVMSNLMLILWNALSRVYDWLHSVYMTLTCCYMLLDYILVW